MNLRSLDLKLLSVFDAVLRKKSLTAAAEQLGLTQPAVSQSLAKLRKEFADPLFVRTTQGMVPTALASNLSATVREVLDIVRDRLDPAPRFDPLASEREFAVAMSDAGMAVFLPRLNERMAKAAPGVRLRVRRLDIDDLREGFESGTLDLAIGALPALGAGIRQQRLYSDDYVCLGRAGHAGLKGKLTLKRFRAIKHVVVSAEGTGHAHAAVERLLAEKLPASAIALRVPSFLAAAVIVGETDYLLTVPAAVGRVVAERFGLRVMPAPFPIPPVEIRQYWHERSHRDAGNRWLRELIHARFGGGARA